MASMRHLAVVVVAALVFAVIAPAFAQPFADVPTNHWAYDAIAELAAKGLIEGYPDGTFKGDRAMTRYEMAMVVARLLARIESIQIPAPQAPQVTKADLDAIQRLVNEFRAELAALGVRVTALEEEINAIKAKLDNVRITGGLTYRLAIQQTAAVPNTTFTNNQPGTRIALKDASTVALTPDNILFFGVRFDGSVAPNVHLVVGLLSNINGTSGSEGVDFNSSNFGFSGTPSQDVLAAIDLLFFDWKNAFGTPLEVWLGRFGGGRNGQPAPYATYPVRFGPFGLIMRTDNNLWSDSANNTASRSVDGLALFGNWPGLADLKIQGLIARVTGGTGQTSYFSGEDAYGFDANVRILPGLRIGGAYVTNSFTNAGGFPSGSFAAPLGPLYHIYGPAGDPMLNPPTANCPQALTNAAAGAVRTGIECPASGSGWSGYLQYDIMSWLHFDGEYAGWNDAVLGGTDTGWQVNFHVNLGAVTGVGHNLLLDLGYADFGQNFYPPYGDEGLDSWTYGYGAPLVSESFYPGNVQGFLGRIQFDPAPGWTLYGNYASGNWISNGQSFNAFQAGVIYTGLAPSTSVTAYIRQITANGVNETLRYRLELTYRF